MPVSAGDVKVNPALPPPAEFKGMLLTPGIAAAPQTIGTKQSERQVASHPPRNMLANRPEPDPLVNNGVTWRSELVVAGTCEGKVDILQGSDVATELVRIDKGLSASEGAKGGTEWHKC